MGRRLPSSLLSSLALLAGLALVGPAVARADDPPAPEAPKPDEPAPETPKAEVAPEPETLTLTAGPFSVLIELDAAFEPAEALEIAWRPESLGGEVEVVEAVKPGAVEAGQVLVVLKAARQQEQVGLARLDLEIATAHLGRLVEEDKRREQARQLQRGSLKREAQRAADDLTRFLEVERELRKTESLHGIKGSENSLQDSIEELAQLEKMYKADDLTEETEDIVLKRSQRELGRQKDRLGFQKLRNDWFLAITLPRDQENLEQRALETRLELERFEATDAFTVAKSQAEIKKATQELELQRQALARLEADLLVLILRAPKAGQVVPGTLVRGRWQGVEAATQALKPGEKVRANQVLLTLVEAGDLRVRSQLGEAQLFQLAEGSKGTITPTAADDLKLPVTVRSLALAGVDGKHDLVLSLDAGDPRLLPGLTGKLKLRAKEREGVLTVPESAVSRDGGEAKVHVRADGVTTARKVKLGATSEGRIELREGVQAGERVLVTAPGK